MITLAVFLFVGAVVVRTVVAAGSESPSVTVTVAPGDSLWSIAEREMPGVDTREAVDRIEQLNGLSNASVPVGVVLEVPAGGDQ